MIDQEEIHNQCLSKNPKERIKALEKLKDNLSQLPDKQQAWNDLHKLTSDKCIDVRFKAVSALGSAFSDVPDKQQAWNDLHKLTSDKYSDVRSEAASALGSVFYHVPDKQQAWNDLIILTSDEDSDVRTYANHSLGKVCIFNASKSETEEDYKEELEKAIEFFKKAVLEPNWSNPAQFCLPFYNSFYMVIFKKQESKEVVDKYLAEAKVAVKGSKSKEALFEAVNNLANALKEVQNLENLNLEAKKCELNFYRKYCDHAAELMRYTEEKAPSATRVLIKGFPILDRKLKGLIEEIQNKTKDACKELQGTPNAEIACTIYRKAQKLEISNPEELAQNIEDIAYTLKSQLVDTPKNDYILNKIDLITSEVDLTKKTQILSYVTAYVIGQMLKEKQIPIKIEGNENNVIINSKDSSII